MLRNFGRLPPKSWVWPGFSDYFDGCRPACQRLAQKRVRSIMKNLLLSLTLCLLAVSILSTAQAQEVLLPRAYETTNVGIVYDREVSFPVSLHTNGFFFGVYSGKLKTYYKTSYWGFTIGHLKDKREAKQSDSQGGAFRNSSSSYIYGKQRTLVPLRLAKGWKRYWSGKDRRRGVGVATSLELGATAGIAKAYELQVSSFSNEGSPTSGDFISFDDDPEAFLDDNGRIIGAGGLRRGWSNVRIYPGVNAKAAVHLDWGAFDEFMRAMEAGIMVDVFAADVELLTPPATNSPVFINFYLALQLGKRR